MFVIKGWKHNPRERRCSPGWNVCVCLCAHLRGTLQKTRKLHFLRVSFQTIKYTQNLKMAGYESIYLNIVYVLICNKNSLDTRSLHYIYQQKGGKITV